MPTFTYVTVSYCYVGVGYPVVGYAGVGYSVVSYPVVGYGFVGVSYCYGTVRLLRGRLPWRMVLGNVAKDTPLGLDTGGGG